MQVSKPQSAYELPKFFAANDASRAERLQARAAAVESGVFTRAKRSPPSGRGAYTPSRQST